MIHASPEAAESIREVAARNLIAAVLPFHRLQEADGTAPYYRWGEERRRAILQLERRGVAGWLPGSPPRPGLI
jgi:O6-methylguanine-DNA--protein-cysteine methyltransferase